MTPDDSREMEVLGELIDALASLCAKIDFAEGKTRRATTFSESFEDGQDQETAHGSKQGTQPIIDLWNDSSA